MDAAGRADGERSRKPQGRASAGFDSSSIRHGHVAREEARRIVDPKAAGSNPVVTAMPQNAKRRAIVFSPRTVAGSSPACGTNPLASRAPSRRSSTVKHRLDKPRIACSTHAGGTIIRERPSGKGDGLTHRPLSVRLRLRGPMRPSRSGSVSVRQAEGAGSIPAGRSMRAKHCGDAAVFQAAEVGSIPTVRSTTRSGHERR